MKKMTDIPPATAESFWAALQESKRILTEALIDLAKRQAENERVLTEMFAKTAIKINALTEQVTGITKSNGLFAENYFFNSFERDELNLFGEKYDKLLPGSKGKIVNDQYDFILVNGHTSTIIEVKYKAREGDIEKTLKKVETFRKNFPEYHKHKVYLAIAAMSIIKNFWLC